MKCAAVLLPLVLCPPAHNTDRREGGCTDDPGGETMQEERLINTVKALCVCKAPAIELIRSGLQHTLIKGANEPKAVCTESKGKTCTQRSKGRCQGQMGIIQTPEQKSVLWSGTEMKVLLTHLLGEHSQGHSWLVVSFVSEQKRAGKAL